MNIYIAAPWIHKADALAAQVALEAVGHTVVSHWIKYHSDAVIGAPDDFHELRTQALEDVKDLAESHVLVLLNLSKSEGKATELGFALSLDLRVVLVGERTQIFHYMPGVEVVATVAEAVALLHPIPDHDTRAAITHRR